MLLLIILGALTAVGIIMAVFADEFDVVNIGMSVSFVFGGALAIALVLLPISYHSTKAEVDRYHALKETLQKSREEGSSEIERAALVQEIAQYNKDLASAKYWNETVFDIYIYDGLAELDYLE